MNTYPEFIKVYDNVIDKSICQSIIKAFNADRENVYPGVVSYKNHTAHRSDKYLISTDIRIGEVAEWVEVNNCIHDLIMPYFVEYLSQFAHVNFSKTFLHPESALLSKYPKSQGHFAPHKDLAVTDYTRDLTILIYLNTIRKGGETEFFNQNKLIRPKAGSILFAPSSFEYAHAGLIPESAHKYLIVSFGEVQIEKADD